MGYVCVCVHMCEFEHDEWLVSWLVGFQSIKLLCGSVKYVAFKVFLLKSFFQSLVFFFFLATVWHFHLPSHFLVKDHPKSQLSRKTSDLHLECEMMSSLIQLSLSFSFVVGFMSQYYLWLGHFPRLALSKSQLY